MPDSLGVELVKLQADLHGLKNGLRQGREELASFRGLAKETADSVRSALSFVGLGIGIYALGSALKNAFRSAIQGIDDYKVRIIGIAAQMASMAADQTHLQTTFDNALSYAQQMYRAIAVEQARHYAGANEMMQVYNRLVQGGYNVRLEEVKALGILTDRIMYATQGQGVERQLNTEVLALMEGQARAGSQIALELKQRLGPEWAKLVEQHKKAGDLLQWLSELWPGLNIASKEMENTLASQETRLKSLLTLLGIDGLGGAYQDIVNWLRAAGDYLRDHQELAGKLAQTWNSIQPLVKALVEAFGAMVLAAINLYRILQPISNLMMDLGAALLKDITFIKGIFLSIEAGAAAAKQALMDSCGTDVVGAFRAGMAAMKSSLEDWKLTAIKASNDARFALMNAQPAKTHMHIPFMGGEPTYGEPEPGGGTPELPAQKKRQEAAPKTGKGAHDVLLGQYLSMIRAKRQADLQEAQNALNILKENNKLKKAEYDKDLAAGLIEGQEYYRRLQELQQQETAQALALIEKKRQVQIASNKDALDQLAKQDMSAEAKDIAQQKLKAQNRQALAKLDAEVAKTKLDAEIQVTNELKRQVDLKQQYQQKTEDLNLQTAQLMGAITEQEANLQRLYLDWQRAKQEAIKAGAPPEYFTALEQNYQAKRLDLEFGGMGMSITNGFSSIISEIANGSKDVLSSIQYLFRDVFNEALKPGLQQLRNALVNGFKAVFGESGAGIGYGVLGAVGLLGMMLTRGSSSSWSASGASAGVTSSEAVRGVIAGPTSIPIGDIGESLADALVPAVGLLSEIEVNTRTLATGGGGFSGTGGKAPQSIAVQITGADLMAGFKNVLVETIQEYFAQALMTGAG